MGSAVAMRVSLVLQQPWLGDAILCTSPYPKMARIE
jgi:hypothetical protein